MAGPQIQRPQSAYYTGLNGSSNGHPNGNRGSGAGLEGGAVTTSTSLHTGLHVIRTISHESELIYRGSNGGNNTNQNQNINNNTSAASTTSIQDTCAASTSRNIIQQQPLIGDGAGGRGSSINLATIAGTGQNPNDALIVPAGTLTVAASQNSSETANKNASHSLKSSSSKCKQRSIEIIVDATKCDTKDDEDDVEQGKSRRSSRHRHRPLHRRFLNYLKSLFQGSTTQTGKIFFIMNKKIFLENIFRKYFVAVENFLFSSCRVLFL